MSMLDISLAQSTSAQYHCFGCASYVSQKASMIVGGNMPAQDADAQASIGISLSCPKILGAY